MSELQISTLQSEWVTLQTQFDSYEKYSLIIKLFSILISCMLVFVFDVGIYALMVVLILWLQDGIWKTFQHRIGQRLEIVEQAIQDHSNNTQNETTDMGMQFNLAWNQSRSNAVGLICEYIKQSIKPTVAYPHAVLFVMVVVQFYVS